MEFNKECLKHPEWIENAEAIIVGIPRSGTKYIMNSLGTYHDDIAAYKSKHLKTHSLAPPHNNYDSLSNLTSDYLIKYGGKAIFMFSDPVLAVISSSHNLWPYSVNVRTFGCHLPKDQISSNNLFENDWFNFELMFDTWMGEQHSYEVLGLRYETLPDNYRFVESFVGRDIEWLPWEDRKTTYNSVNPKTLDMIKDTYSNLIEKVKDAPNVILF